MTLREQSTTYVTAKQWRRAQTHGHGRIWDGRRYMLSQCANGEIVWIPVEMIKETIRGNRERD